MLVELKTAGKLAKIPAKRHIKGRTDDRGILRPFSHLIQSCKVVADQLVADSSLLHLNTSIVRESKMSSTAYYQYQPTTSLPVAVPGKQPQQTYTARHNRSSSAYSQYSASPPERPESVSTSSAGLYSSASSNYAGSEYDSSSGATSVDLPDYMNDRLSQAYNPIPMDRSLAKQAQMYVTAKAISFGDVDDSADPENSMRRIANFLRCKRRRERDSPKHGQTLRMA